MPATTLPIRGPYREVELPEGGRVPFFVVPYDENGACSGPVTRASLISTLGATAFTDVFVFSHGWNNTWPAAIERYESFVEGFARTRAQHPLPGTQDFRPVLVGVFWPSAVLVSEGERAPRIAGGGTDDDSVAQHMEELALVAGAVPGAHRTRFYELAQQPYLSGADATDLAALLAPLWSEGAAADELAGEEGALAAEDLARVWEELDRLEAGDGASEFAPRGFGFGGGEAAPAERALPAQPEAAGLLDGLRRLSPRNIVRTTTVRMMKDRAGHVGGRGVHELLRDILAASASRVHLVGHSYGGKVVLSALCAGDLPRPVDSALLLQPAVSYLCFAGDVPGLGRPGGYRAALDPARLRAPVRTTFSRHDVPLTRIFHLALRRKTDLGEVVIAGEPPGRYAALGGFGPGELGEEATVEAAHDPGEPYPRPPHARVVGIEASRVISGHGDVSNPATWWMLLDQVGPGA